MAEQPGLSFAVLLRQLRAKALLTQEELAEAASLSPRSVSDLERGINRTARKETALLLADALGLAGPTRELFVAVARGQAPTEQMLAAARATLAAGAVPGLQGAGGRSTGGQGELAWLLGEVIDSPYRGLAAFEEQDAAFFFGRETATAQVLDRMSRQLARAGVLVVSGVSGAGKSSLLRAGVLPRIRAAGLAAAPGSASWPCLVFTPTRAPLDELALRVALLAGTDASAVRRGLGTSPEGFALPVRQAALVRSPGSAGDPDGLVARRGQPARQRLLLVVDQFEELFTQCADEGQRQAFITALHAAASARHGPDQTAAALVVLGVRADFEARSADYPELADAVQDRYLVTAMTGRQLRMAITEPAKKADSQVDDDLAEVLLAEARTRQPAVSGAGILPLLSHALDQAWRSRAGQAVTLADYARTGGIEGAVAGSAQRAYDRLTPGQQAAARQVFTRLTATSAEGVDYADRATKAELTEGKSAIEAQDVETVLEAFAAERLLTLATGTVEISHEALLTAWPLLRDEWLADTHADRIARTRLHHTAADWAHHSRDPSYLYSGSLLQAATDTADRIGADPARHPPLSQTERDFLHASNHAHRRTARQRQAVIAGLLVLTLAAITAAGIAAHNAAFATRQHALALSRQLAAESLTLAPANPLIARQLAVAAWRVFPTAQAGSAMATLLAEQQQKGMLPADPAGVSGVAFSPNGRLLASADGDGTVRLWNPATGHPVGAPLHATSNPNGVSGVAFSPDGKLLASADADGTVRLWKNPATGHPVGATLRATRAPWGPRGGVRGVAFSPDGKLLASADGDGTVRLWNPATGHPVATLHATSAAYGVFGVAFSPDGKLLASADFNDGTVRLWNPATGHPVATLQTSQYNVLGVAFSPDGKLLASAGGDGTVRLWNPATGQPAGTSPQTAQNSVLGVAFSPDGKLLASAGGDGTVRLWNPLTGQPAGTPPQNSVRGVAFSPDGRLLASAGGDGTVRLWNPVTGQPAGTPLHTTSTGYSVFGVAFSPDGRLLASADADGTVQLWDPVTGQPDGAPLHASTGGGVFGVAFSPDGKLLASAGGDGTVRLWNPATGHPDGAPLHTTSTGRGVLGVAFSPDGKLLASADADGTVQLWDPVTGQPDGAPLHASTGGGVFGVAFSPDGKLLASADADGTVRLWNPATGHPDATLHATRAGSRYGVRGVAFSPDGLLASAGADGTVRLWNPATGRPLGAPLHASAGVLGVAFSPDGKLLASAGADGTVQLWDPVTGRPDGAFLRVTTSTARGVFGVAFSPDGKLLAGAASDGTILEEVWLFAHPYEALCADVGPPTAQTWGSYAPGERQPKVCA